MAVEQMISCPQFANFHLNSSCLIWESLGFLRAAAMKHSRAFKHQLCYDLSIVESLVLIKGMFLLHHLVVDED